MIDEQRHDLVVEYVFGLLEGEAQHEFEAWLASDSELQALVSELREAAASLALLAPQRPLPPHLRAHVLSAVRGESAAGSAAETAGPLRDRARGWIPWTIAAGLAITGVVLLSERARWRQAAQDAGGEVARSFAAVQSSRDQAMGLAEQLVVYQAQAKTHADQIASLREEVVQLRGRDALAQIHVATLSAQVAAFARAGAIVVWDPQEQRGIVKLVNLPTPEAGKDYQLWVIDPKNPAPISAGVVPVTADGAARVSFKPVQAVATAGKFAISIEPTGGVAQVAGPIVFLGE